MVIFLSKKFFNYKNMKIYNFLYHFLNNGVFTGVFSCWRVACEDAGQAVYNQLCLHITGEYNHHQAGISC